MHETENPEGASLDDLLVTLEHIDLGLSYMLVSQLQIRDLLTALVMGTNPELGKKIDELHDEGKLWNATLPHLAGKVAPAQVTDED